MLHRNYRGRRLEVIANFTLQNFLKQVRLSDENGKLAEQFKIEVVPSLVLFQNRRPYHFKGDVADERRAISWLREKLDGNKH